MSGNNDERLRDVADGGETAESLDKVRDILFGSQVREQEKRFSRIEERLAADLTTMRDETRRRIDSLEEFVKNEFASLRDHLKTEHNERVAAEKTIDNALDKTRDELEARLGEHDERIDTMKREHREQMLEQSKSLRDELRESNDNLRNALDAAVRELRADKTDRSTLAELLTEMAMRLNDDDN